MGTPMRSQASICRHRESAAAVAAFIRYLELGHHRFLRNLAATLQQAWGAHAPCLSTICNWSIWFDWQVRAKEYDQQLGQKSAEVLTTAVSCEAVRRLEQRFEITGYVMDIVASFVVQAYSEALSTPDGARDVLRRMASDGTGRLFLRLFERIAESDRLDATLLNSAIDKVAVFTGESESPWNAERNFPADSDFIQDLRELTARLREMTGESN